MTNKKKDMTQTNTKQKTAVKKTQVIGCRLHKTEYDLLEIKCFENRHKISQVIKKAVREYLTETN